MAAFNRNRAIMSDAFWRAQGISPDPADRQIGEILQPPTCSRHLPKLQPFPGLRARLPFAGLHRASPREAAQTCSPLKAAVYRAALRLRNPLKFILSFVGGHANVTEAGAVRNRPGGGGL